jgi:1-aminocyclopropane-1-carboxylate deaminase/D-cysteine desulfhydrase-like pyridoxal-dependent ACC family enzyme
MKNIKRINLEIWPTPIHKLSRFGQLIGNENTYIKRDDISLTGLGGNKLRKLEYWLGEARSREATKIVVAGGEQSNLVRLTAAACAKSGFDCIAIHNCKRPARFQGNMLLNKLFGAEQIFIGDVTEGERDLFVKDKISQLTKIGEVPYCINNEEIGSLGYTNCLYEIDNQSPDTKHLVIVGAMGITASGFIFANRVLKNKYTIHVISVEYEKEKLIKILAKKLLFLEGNALEDVSWLKFDKSDLEKQYNSYVYDDYMGKGWGITTEESLQTIREMAQLEGILLDHVYNAKTFTGLKGLVANGVIKNGEKTCIVHTGGAPAIFGHAEIYQDLDNS